MYCTKRKYIKIDGKIIEKFYVLICENSHNNQIIEKDKKLKTTKKDAQNHGFGISDIKRTVRHYNGDVYITYNEDIFTLKIIIPI